MNFVYFDLETERAVDEVGGWSQIEQLGLAVAVTQSSRDGDFRVYRREDAAALLRELQGADCVVGYNTRGFDFRVLQVYVDYDLKQLNNIDLMLDLKKAAGFRPSLENCCTATLGRGKSSSGLQSVQWWREGRHDEVIAYCKQDVELTRLLHEFGASNSYVKCLDRRGRLRVLSVPWKLSHEPPAPPQQGTLF